MTATSPLEAGGHTPGTPLPWAYRPQEHDDWGVVRTTVEIEGGWKPVVVQARYDGDPSSHDLDSHRLNGTDPAEQNARYIVRACNSFPELLAQLEFAVKLLRPFGHTAQVQAMEAAIARARSEHTQ